MTTYQVDGLFFFFPFVKTLVIDHCAACRCALCVAQVMNYNPANPKWHNRDRFVLSNGHACALQYWFVLASNFVPLPHSNKQQRVAIEARSHLQFPSGCSQPVCVALSCVWSFFFNPFGSMLHLTGYNISMDDLKQFRFVQRIDVSFFWEQWHAQQAMSFNS